MRLRYGGLMALASIYEDGSRRHAAKIGGAGLQIVRDWVVRFNTEGPGWSSRPQGPGQGATDAQP